MPRHEPPPDVYALADARAAARRARDWPAADDLKVRIEAAGWKVVDTGNFYDLVQAVPADEIEDGVVRYGSSASVPSRLDETPVGVATVVVVADTSSEGLPETLRALVACAPDGTQIVVVANGLRGLASAALDALDAADPGAPGIVTEVVHTAERLGAAAALNAGLRRAMAAVVVQVQPGVEPAGDLLSSLAAVLEDPTVGVAGPFGLVTDDLRQYDPAPPGTRDVEAIDGAVMAFRRADFVARGPLDEHFVVSGHLDAWWSLTLRDPLLDAGEEDADPDDGEAATLELPQPRRAVQVAGLVVARPPRGVQAGDTTGEGNRERLARKAFYRYLKYYATRRDLLVGAHEGPPTAG